MKNFIKRSLKRAGDLMFPDESQNLKVELQRIATRTSAEYICKHMRNIQSVDGPYSVHDVAIDKVSVHDGLVLEFGVFSAKTINYIATRRDWVVHGFDSFEGLPENWRDGFSKTHFKMEKLPDVRDNVHLHKGWFDESIPDFLKSLNDRSKKIAYLHVDCDLYSSTTTIFDLLGDRIVPGTVIVFDEYFNYDGWEWGEFLAFKEFITRNSIRYEYLTYNYRHEQVAVLIK